MRQGRFENFIDQMILISGQEELESLLPQLAAFREIFCCGAQDFLCFLGFPRCLQHVDLQTEKKMTIKMAQEKRVNNPRG